MDVDIRKELSIMTSSSPIDIVSELHRQKEDLDSKIYIFEVLNIVDSVKKLIGSEILKDVGSIVIKREFDPDLRGYVLEERLKDFSGEVMPRYDIAGEFVKPLAEFKKLFKRIAGFHDSRVNEEFKEYTSIQIKLIAGAENEFLELLLSKELKTVLEYNLLQNSVEDGATSSPKRPKI